MRPLYVMVGLPIALALTVTTAFEASVTPARVEIEIPEPPTLAVIDSQRGLVYEGHITSFARTPLELLRIEGLGRPAGPLASHRDTALAALLEPVGGTQTPRDPARLEPGRRVVAYLWVPVPRHGVPDTLVNRLVFSPADSAASPQDETVAEAAVPVRRAEAVVRSPPLPEGMWLAGDGPSND